jgi:hypothetical protein
MSSSIPTHQELADRIGSSRVVVSRALRDLIDEEDRLSAQGRALRLPMSALVLRDEL